MTIRETLRKIEKYPARTARAVTARNDAARMTLALPFYRAAGTGQLVGALQ